MYIKELYQKADREKTEYAYFLNYPTVNQTVNSKREYWLNEFCNAQRKIRVKFEILKGQEVNEVPGYTVYVCEKSWGLIDENRYPSLDIAVIKDSEIDRLLNDLSTGWSSDAKQLLACGIDQEFDRNNLGSYKIADSSVEKFGIEMCCAAIIHAVVDFTGADHKWQLKYRHKLSVVANKLENDPRPMNVEEEETDFKRLRSDYWREKKIFDLKVDPINKRFMTWAYQSDFCELVDQVRHEHLLNMT